MLKNNNRGRFRFFLGGVVLIKNDVIEGWYKYVLKVDNEDDGLNFFWVSVFGFMWNSWSLKI